jgi:hypothetical protein
MREAPVRVDVAQTHDEVGVPRVAGGIERGGQRTRYLQGLLEDGGGVGKHVRPFLHRPLIAWAHIHALNQAREADRTPDRRRRIAWIVQVRVGGLFTWLFGGEAATIALGVTVAVEEPTDVLGAGQRPFVLVAPRVLAHHKDPHRRRIVHPVRLAFEVMREVL